MRKKYIRVPLEERFWSKVDRNGPIPEYAPHLGPCWLWTSVLTRGYGSFNLGGMRPAYRVAWEISVGPIPDGLMLDHLCRVRSCVRPSHLEPVTNAENILRGVGFSAVNARKQVCLRGHDDWIPRRSEGVRVCRTCRIDRDRKGRADRAARRPPTPKRTGELNPMAKLRADQIPEIRRLLADGHSHSQVAALFGVGPTAIGRIATGQGWKGA